MHVINTKFKGLKIIQQKKHGDNRGNLRETFRKKIIFSIKFTWCLQNIKNTNF